MGGDVSERRHSPGKMSATQGVPGTGSCTSRPTAAFRCPNGPIRRVAFGNLDVQPPTYHVPRWFDEPSRDERTLENERPTHSAISSSGTNHSNQSSQPDAAFHLSSAPIHQRALAPSHRPPRVPCQFQPVGTARHFEVLRAFLPESACFP